MIKTCARISTGFSHYHPRDDLTTEFSKCSHEISIFQIENITSIWSKKSCQRGPPAQNEYRGGLLPVYFRDNEL